MQIGCDYILPINTVGHMTIFYPKQGRGPLCSRKLYEYVSHLKSLNITFSRIKQPNCLK